MASKPDTDVLIPCSSNMPDRDHDCVVVKVGDYLLEQLRRCREAFTAAPGPELYRHEYRGGPVFLVEDENAEFDPQFDDKIMNLGDWLESEDPERFKLTLTLAQGVYLSVVEEGFFYSFFGDYNKHGPSEEYQTYVFTLRELEEAIKT